MDNNETMVENDYAEADDTLEEGLVEETDESGTQDLDEFIKSESDDSEDEPQDEPEQPKGSNGPGYVQKRIEKALAKERASITAEITAKLEAQYAPLRERLLEMDAKELVKSGEVKDLETAKELVRYRQGQPVQPRKDQQPRNEQGQFTSQQEAIENARTEARIAVLKHQAEKIKANGGPDVIAEFSNNPEVKQKVISGEIDFYDVADMMKAPKKRPPAPMRSPNGASGSEKSTIASMTDEQFEKFENKVSGGARFAVK